MARDGEPLAETGFRSADDAERRIAGVAAAARAVQALVREGARDIRLLIGDGAPLSAETLADIERLRGPARVEVAAGNAPSLPLPSGWEIVHATGKAGDGLVSRWLNRPISQRISWLLLHVPRLRPFHVTLFNALLGLALVPPLVFGGDTGLIIGGILFHSASVLDGVDGEMARATGRSSPRGATMDSVIDVATNLLFVSALTANLAQRDGGMIGWVGAWAVTLSIAGGALIAWRGRRRSAPVGFDLLKRREHKLRGPFDLIYWGVQTLTGRDCFAFLYMMLIFVGLERTALGIYAGVGTIWFGYALVVLALAPRRREWTPLAPAPLPETRL